MQNINDVTKVLFTVGPWPVWNDAMGPVASWLIVPFMGGQS